MARRQLKSAVAAELVAKDLSGVRATVTDVIADIRARGDIAVREYSEKFDKWSPESFRLSDAKVQEIIA